MPQASRLPLRPLLIVSMLVLVAATYWPALRGGFIFDDYPIFAENQAIHVHGLDWHEWHRVWQWSIANIERPMAMLSYALNYALGGSTFGFKLTNLWIHLLNTLLVLMLTQRLVATGSPGEDGRRLTQSQVFYTALGIACAWAAHPLQVSTVMYVVQRMEMLGFTFVLLALLAYWHARQNQRRGRRSWPWLMLTLALVPAGYCFKETAILAPGYALLLELTLLRFEAADARIGHALKFFYGLGCAAATAVVVFYLIPHYSRPENYSWRDFTAAQRELTQLRALPMYIGWSVLPLLNHLTFYYDNYVASTGLLQPASTLLGALFLLALVVLALVMRRRRPLLALGIGWFFVAHLLTSSPLPLELVFEHRNYPALFGIVLTLADMLWWLAGRINAKVAALIGCALLLNFASLTLLRAMTWASPARLAVELTQTNPGSLRASMDLARRYRAMSGGDAQSPFYGRSVEELKRAASLRSDSPLPEEALLLEASVHPGTPAQPWWDGLRRKLQTRPLINDTYLTLHKLVNARLAGNTGIDAQQLAACYEIALRRNPGREMLHAEYAELAGAVLQDKDLAIAHWRQTLKLDQDVTQYAPTLAEYLTDRQRDDEATAVITEAMALHPSLAHDPRLNRLLDKARSSRSQAKPSTALQRP